ncbi:MAG TPA: hypothetical protein DCL41_09445 [Bdellovibrionales bacterium]|nr:hypothetical protein [Pseudobdellovibrionaceae bacterium]HAG92085.1 hypothetical protein [Bdellovibrionales bacterium]|tara:strand:+ start:2618 stop:3205 length:588 start_codon:yes stop_codon:yes gene_type:complete
MSLLEFKNFSIRLRGQKTSLFEPLSFHMDPGSLLILTGPNGSGKSTLLKFISGQRQSYEGNFQNHVPLEKVVFLPQVLRSQFLLPIQLNEISQLLPGESLYHVSEKSLWSHSSGGERQKTLLNLVFRKPADLILLDEPFNHLDQDAQSLLVSAMEKRMSQGTSFVLSSHSLEGFKNLNFQEISIRKNLNSEERSL